MNNVAATNFLRLRSCFKQIAILFAFALLTTETQAADLLGLWNNTAQFIFDKAYTSEMQPGHKEGFAVDRPDVIVNGKPTVYLYHRCFDANFRPQICLQIYDQSVKTLLQNVGLIVSPTLGYFAAAPSIAKINGVWTMVYEEGGGGIYWATSSDGVTWTKKGSLFTDGIIRATPSLYTFQGVVYVFYAQYLDSAHTHLGIIFHSGPSMSQLVQYGGGYVLKGSQPWDAGSVQMPRIVLQGGYHWMFYEGGSMNFSCSPSLGEQNLMGWGIARSTDLIHWEKWTKNPIMRHDPVAAGDTESCGYDMPQPFISPSTGKTHVFYTSNDRNVLHKDILIDGPACGQNQTFPNWNGFNHQCTSSCGVMGGTLCYETKSCGSGSRLGMSHDCGSCCR